MDTARFKKLPLMGIVRGVGPDELEPLLDAAGSAGLETIEITMNTAGASGLIRKATKVSRARMTIGAGTVLDTESLRAALDAGASFVVMPVLVDDVMEYCAKRGIPAFPGALTPYEIYRAWRSGAAMVKVFPASLVGPAYFKEIKGPFQDIELMACGGVTPENMGRYLSSGAGAVTFGSSVFRREWLARREFRSIELRVRSYVRAYRMWAQRGIAKQIRSTKSETRNKSEIRNPKFEKNTKQIRYSNFEF